MTALKGAIAVYTTGAKQSRSCSAEKLAAFFGDRRIVTGWDGVSPLGDHDLAIVDFQPDPAIVPNVLWCPTAEELMRGPYGGLRTAGVTVDEPRG